MEDAHKLFKIPKSECPDIWIRLPRHKWPKSWSSMEDPIVPLERNLCGHPSAGLLWERQFEKILLKHGWEKSPNWECLFDNRGKALFLSLFVDDIKLFGKRQNINSTWKILMKDVDLGEPTSCIDHVYLGCTQRLWIKHRYCDKMERYLRIQDFCWSRGKTTHKSFRETWCPKRYLLGPTTWKVMHRNVWKDIANLRIKRLDNFSKLQLHAWMTIILKKNKMGCVGELSEVWSQIFLKWLYLARIGRPDILKWTNLPMQLQKVLVFTVAHERETRARTRTRRSHHITTPTTTPMGWRFVTDSYWTLWHPSGSRQGHPRYAGARTRRPWVARQTPHATPQRKTKKTSLESIVFAEKWTKACDKRFARLMSYIHQTREYRQFCCVRNTAHQCRLGLFQDSDVARHLEDSKSTSGGSFVHFWTSNICANKLHVQETGISLTRLNRSWNYFSRCRFTHGWDSRSRCLWFRV